MFEYEAESSGFSAFLCVLQLFFAPLGCLVFTIVLGSFSEGLLRVVTKDRRAELLHDYIAFILGGCALGYMMQTAIPRARQSGGLWVWILPCCVLIWGVLDQSLREPGTVIGSYFIFSHGDEGLGVILITGPTVAACFYSVGIALASRPATTAMGAAFRRVILRSPFTKLARIFQ